MKNFTSEQIAQIKEMIAQAIAEVSHKCNITKDSDKEVTPRPLGVWCLTEKYRAIKPTKWEEQNN